MSESKLIDAAIYIARALCLRAADYPHRYVRLATYLSETFGLSISDFALALQFLQEDRRDAEPKADAN